MKSEEGKTSPLYFRRNYNCYYGGDKNERFQKNGISIFAAICVLAGCLFGMVRYVAEVLIGRHDDEIMDV